MAECLLQLIDDALSNREIADTFVISIGTVKYDAGQIYDKLQVISQTQAVAQVSEKGILQKLLHYWELFKPVFGYFLY